MSGFLSREAENALMGNAEDAQRLFDAQMAFASGTAFADPRAGTPLVDENAQWAHAHTSSTGHDFFHPYPAPLVPPNAFPLPPGAPLDPGIGPSAMVPPLPADACSRSGSVYSATSSPELVQGSLPGSARMPTFPPAMRTLSSSTELAFAPLPAGGLIADTSAATTTSSSSAAPSRSATPHPPDLAPYGTLNNDQRSWTCAYPGCSSRAIFARPCDLRKHFRRHSKHFFCRHEACPQAHEGGFSSKKDRARHEAKHNPGVECEWEGCERVFSRVDNMRNHMQRSQCYHL